MTTDATHKICKICGELKPLTEFYKKTDGKFGVTAECKICRCLKDGFTPAAWREKIPEGMRRCTGGCAQVLPLDADHFNRTPNGFMYQCRNCRKAKRKTEYANDADIREQAATKTRQWYQKNREQALERKRIYSRAHAADAVQRVRRWREDNPDKFKAHNRIKEHRRRARKLSLPDTFTQSDWQECLTYWNGHCAYCGNPAGLFPGMEICQEHFIPLEKTDICPGTVAGNIIPACKSCNSSKNASAADEWLARKFGERKARQILSHIHQYFEWVKR